MFCDLQPSKLLLDGEGGIKYSDFSLARVEGENLDELLSMFVPGSDDEEAAGDDTKTDDSSSKPKTSTKVGLIYGTKGHSFIIRMCSLFLLSDDRVHRITWRRR